MDDETIGQTEVRGKAFPAALYEDEVVDYLAERYRTSPGMIVGCFARIEEEGKAASVPFLLEENEMELLRALTEHYRRKKDEMVHE